MIIVKWFWANINFRKWTFEGRELANPLRIIWRLIMIVPVFSSLILYGLTRALYDLDYQTFVDTWEDR